MSIKAIINHETCRLVGHQWCEYQNVHHTKVDDGIWTAVVNETGRECKRCGMKADVKVTRR